MNATVRMAVTDPCLRAVRQLSEPASEDVVLRESGKFRIGRGQGLEQCVVDHRPAGLLCPFFRFAATRLERGRDLDPRIEVLYRWKFREQLFLELVASCLPALAQLCGRVGIEGHTVSSNSIADGGDAVLELERYAGIA